MGTMVTTTRAARVPALLLVLGALALEVFASMSVVSAEYTTKDAVVILTDKNFEKEVLSSPDYWLVEFYAPWCGHCKNLEPEYKAAAKKLKQHARLGVVDATVHTVLAQKYKIKGYPTVKEFGANKKKPRDYQGGRTRKDIVQYVKNSDEAKKLGVSGVAVQTVEYKSLHTFLHQDEATPTALFFGSRRKNGAAASKPPAWVSSLAKHFSKNVKGKNKKKTTTTTEPTVRLAFVPGSEEKIAKHLQIEDQLPALVFIDDTNIKFVSASGSAIASEAGAKKFISNALASKDADGREAWTTLPLFPAPEVAKKKPRVQVDGLNDQEITKCLAKKGKMCVIVTKSTVDNEGGDAVKELAKRYRRDPFLFLVAEKEDPVFRKLANFLKVPDATAVVLKPGKSAKFTELTGEADEATLSQLLDRIIDGSTQFRVSSRSVEKLFAAGGEKTSEVHEEL